MPMDGSLAIWLHLRKGRVIAGGDTMKVGDLVRNVYTGEVGLIIEEPPNSEYVIVDDRWTVPREHLEVINEGR